MRCARLLPLPASRTFRPMLYISTTIHQLAAVAAQVSRSAMASVDLCTNKERSRRLLKLVAKYMHNWPKHQPADDATNPTDETILLTGSTGGLGSQILAQLVAMLSVSRIFAFNRPARIIQSHLDSTNRAGINYFYTSSTPLLFQYPIQLSTSSLPNRVKRDALRDGASAAITVVAYIAIAITPLSCTASISPGTADTLRKTYSNEPLQAVRA
ncbi:hypothetical protein JB92DRAFT_1336320 [Gautieria morchelliformis]|nr:hypothetical protein JB92DRAFT_1336320 [Gautieria morchelliformis]